MSLNSPSGQIPGTNAGLTMDVRSLERLKASSSASPKSAIRETAKQLESLFMQELMKSMRASTMSTGMLDNQATEMGTSMLDTQFAGQMTGRPGGLSDLITRQLERQMGIKSDASSAASTASWAVARSRISPIMMMSGSDRRMAGSTAAKLRPAL